MRSSNRLTRRSAKRALDGTGSSGDPAVDEVLAAALAPPTGAESDREDELAALFTATRSRAEGQVQARPTRGRLTAAKVTVAAVTAVLVTGGGVFAASTGHLPEVLTGDDQAGPARPGNRPGDRPGDRPDGRPGGRTTQTPPPTDPPARQPSQGSSAPGTSLTELCRAFQKESAQRPNGAAADPEFSALAEEAGGSDNIARFCAHLTARPDPGSGTAQPTPSALPTPGAEPTEKTTEPTEKPKTPKG